MKKEIPLFIVFVAGAFMAVQFYVPHAYSEYAYEFALDWTIIIGVFAMALGIWSLIRVSADKIRRRSENWQYSLVTLAGLAGMILFGSFFMRLMGAGKTGLEAHMFRYIFNYVMVPINATMFALLAFFIASASFRAFRARSVVATVLLVAAVVVMLRFNPYMGAVGPADAELSNWVMNVLNLAAKRAVAMGIGLGGVAMALKIVLGIERSYMGRD